jgi:hypothetical protein
VSAGPLRRVIGVLGLLALAPIAVALATGTVAPEDAALRAVAVGAAVVAVGRVARAVLSATVRRVEADVEDVDRADEGAGDRAVA